MGIIGSFFTNPERSFANWAMDLQFNKDINVELRFCSNDPSEAKHAYLNIPAETESSPNLTLDERSRIARIRLDNLQKKAKKAAEQPIYPLSKIEKPIDSASVSADLSQEPVEPSIVKKDLPDESIKLSHSQKIDETPPVKPQESAPFSRAAVVPTLFQSIDFVSHVEKFNTSELVKYGKFSAYSYFTESLWVTPYFLVEGWLVVSHAKDFIEVPFKFRNGNEIEIDPYDLQYQKYDALKEQLQKVIKAWFKFERKKLWALLATSFAGSLLFSAMVLAVRKSNDSVDKIQSNFFLTLSLFLEYVAINSGVTLYKLYELEFSVLHIENVGLWVHHLRLFAIKYKDITAKHPAVAKFFTPKEQTVLFKQVRHNFKV